MSGQYFENNQDLKHDIKEIKYYYLEKEIILYTDNGVFSKNNIDFGTNLLLKNLTLKGDETILDMGCGYGIMGISIASIYPNTKVLMCDVNDRAIELVSRGITKNKTKNASVIHSNMYENIDSQFSVILTNPPIRAGKKIVHNILLDGYNYLQDNGYLVCVMKKQQGALSAIKAMEEVYKKVEVIAKDKGYLIIKALK